MKMEENHSHPGTRYETDEHARENDADSMLDDIDEPEEVMDEDTEADDEDDFEGSQTELILTEMSPAVIEEDDESQVSNSSSSRSKSDEKDDDDSRGQSKAVDSPAISPPMSRKRRIQDVAPVETDKSQVCNLPTDLEIREGKDYQALVPEYVERSEEERSSEVEKEVKHWVPVDQAGELNEDKIDAYCDLCEQEYKMNRHQSLYMLYLSSYNIEEAKAKCAQRAAYKEEWSAEDKHLFQQYLNIFGKNFGRINTAMPHKTPSALIEQYYNTKKTHSQKSFFDADHHAHKEGEDEYDESSDEEEEGLRCHS
uniref:SANT domain-containing protein n=1 Tax=Steinernema glaseri TaxID=37863 RepID=A0A1I7ZUR5_9BILA